MGNDSSVEIKEDKRYRIKLFAKNPREIDMFLNGGKKYEEMYNRTIDVHFGGVELENYDCLDTILEEVNKRHCRVVVFKTDYTWNGQYENPPRPLDLKMFLGHGDIFEKLETLQIRGITNMEDFEMFMVSLTNAPALKTLEIGQLYIDRINDVPKMEYLNRYHNSLKEAFKRTALKYCTWNPEYLNADRFPRGERELNQLLETSIDKRELPIYSKTKSAAKSMKMSSFT